MLEVLTGLFDPTGFPARKECGTGWTPTLIWMHVSSDLFIWLAYVSIPLILLYFTRRRDLPFPRLFVLFALFILACGTTHLIDAIIFEYPVYRFAALMKVVTAVVSWATVIALVPVIPRVMHAFGGGDQDREGHEGPPPAARGARAGAPATTSSRCWPRCLAILVRAAVDPVLQDDQIFVVALLAVVYVSWKSGFGPGIACLVVGVGGYMYFFVHPRNSFVVEHFGYADGDRAVLLLRGGVRGAGRVAADGAPAGAGGARHRGGTRRRNWKAEVVRRRVVEAALRQREQDLVGAQRETAEALARLNAFLDNAPVGIAFFDPDLRYKRINTYLAEANGKSVGEHTGRLLPEVLPDFPPDILAAYRKAAGPKGVPFTAQFRRPDRGRRRAAGVARDRVPGARRRAARTSAPGWWPRT